MKLSNTDDGWLTGRLYFNREDKRVIIKRPRSGFGYTMNLGNKWGKKEKNVMMPLFAGSAVCFWITALH